MIAPIEITADAPVRAVFTTREGGASQGPYAGLNLGSTSGDRADAVRANRRDLCRVLDVVPERVTMARQVHGAAVQRIETPSRPGRFTGALRGWPAGDALVTDRPGIALVVLAADCLPILVWRRDGRGVAAAHAGWRGLVDGVVEAAVEALGAPERQSAAIGPGIGPEHYEVGDEVRERFSARFGEAVVVGRAVDLAAAARRALLDAGVPASGVHALDACTYGDSDRFFSYRRDGAATGRQAGLVWMTDVGAQ